MINKLDFINVISKYHLNGIVESVKFEIKNNNLNIKFTSPNKEMLGEINYSKFNIQDSIIGINNTTQLLKLLNITAGDLMLDYTKKNHLITKLIISDTQFTLTYSLADLITIPKSGKYTGPDIYDITTTLNQENINALIKAKSALAESSTLVLESSENLDGKPQLDIIFGGDIEHANKVSYYLSDLTLENISPGFKICFNSDIFKEILSVNKDSNTSKLYVNLEGIMKLEFETEDTKSVYYLVKKEAN